MVEFFGVGLAATVFAVPLFLAIALLGLAVPYLAIRLRDEGPADPQLGAKILFQFGFSAGLLLVLAGTTTLAVEWMTSTDAPRPTRDNPFGRVTVDYLLSEGFSVAERAGAGVILSGLMALAAAAMCLHSTTAAHRPRVRRTFLGWRLAIHCAVVLGTLTMMWALVLQRGAFQQPLVVGLRAVLAAFFVWGTSGVVHLLLLFNAMQRIVPSGADPAAAAAAKSPPAVLPAMLEVIEQKTSWEMVDGREPPSAADFGFVTTAPPVWEAPRLFEAPPAGDKPLLLTPDMLAEPDESAFPSSKDGATAAE